MMKKYRIFDGRIFESEDSISEILVFITPDDNEKKYLINNLKIDEHTLNSSLDPDELSRLEFEPEHAAIIFKGVKNYMPSDGFVLRVSPIGLFLFNEKLIIVLPEAIPLFEGKHFSKILNLKDLVLRVIYRTIFCYFENLKSINAISEELEKKINSALENKHLHHLFTLEKSLVYYLNAISANVSLIDKIKLNSTKIGFSPEQGELLDDIIIENTQCLRQAEIYSNILASLMDARVSIVSNNLNLIMKTLTIITVSIMLPTLIVSIFSMNVSFPFQVRSWAFYAILSGAFASMVGVIVFWKFKKW